MEEKINRSSAMKTIGALGVASTLISGKAFGQSKKATVFACIGDGSSPWDAVKPVVTSNIEKGLNLTVDYTNDTAMLNDSMLDGYRMLLLIGDFVRDKAQKAAIHAFVQNGGGLLYTHNTINCADRSGKPDVLRDVFGGHWLQHSGTTRNSEEIIEYRIEITNRKHPITQGVNDFATLGEHHYMQYDKDPRYIFMRSVTRDGWAYNDIPGDIHYDERLGSMGVGPSCPAGWAYDYGKGRVCYMSPGHTYLEYMNPPYVKLQQNAVRWCLKQI